MSDSKVPFSFALNESVYEELQNLKKPLELSSSAAMWNNGLTLHEAIENYRKDGKDFGACGERATTLQIMPNFSKFLPPNPLPGKKRNIEFSLPVDAAKKLRDQIDDLGVSDDLFLFTVATEFLWCADHIANGLGVVWIEETYGLGRLNMPWMGLLKKNLGSYHKITLN